MGSKNKSNTEPVGWAIRLAALSLTLLGIVVVFVVRFANNGNEMGAVMWAGMPILLGIVASYLLGFIKKLGSPRRKWQVYTYVLLACVIAITLKTMVL